MSYLDEDSEETKFIHQGYNQEYIDKMINVRTFENTLGFMSRKHYAPFSRDARND